MGGQQHHSQQERALTTTHHNHHHHLQHHHLVVQSNQCQFHLINRLNWTKKHSAGAVDHDEKYACSRHTWAMTMHKATSRTSGGKSRGTRRLGAIARIQSHTLIEWVIYNIGQQCCWIACRWPASAVALPALRLFGAMTRPRQPQLFYCLPATMDDADQANNDNRQSIRARGPRIDDECVFVWVCARMRVC